MHVERGHQSLLVALKILHKIRVFQLKPLGEHKRHEGQAFFQLALNRIAYAAVSCPMVAHNYQQGVIQVVFLLHGLKEGQQVLVQVLDRIVVVVRQFPVESKCKLGYVVILLEKIFEIIQSELMLWFGTKTEVDAAFIKHGFTDGLPERSHIVVSWCIIESIET